MRTERELVDAYKTKNVVIAIARRWVRAGAPDWETYEAAKKEILNLNLPPRDYQAALADLVLELKL